MKRSKNRGAEIGEKDKFMTVDRHFGSGDFVSGSDAVNFGKLPRYLGYQIRQAQTAVFRNFAQIMSDLGITPGEFSLLALVHGNPGIHQTSLVSVYRLDKSTLSNAIKGLKNRDFIRQTRDRNDRRYYGLWLTEYGEEMLVRATERVEAQERRMDSALAPGERIQLLDMLFRISRVFD